MKNRIFGVSLVVVAWLSIGLTATADLLVKISREVIEEAVERAAKTSGQKSLEQGLRKSASDTLERLVKSHGSDVLKTVENGGIELLEGVARYGDDVIDFAIQASPSARRAFARNLSDLLPLVRRVGVESLELEARSPGFASKVFATFGDDLGRIVANNVPTEDIPRLLSYAEKAESSATRKALLDVYRKEGKKLFERIPPRLVLASGLSASMLLGTHEMTAPARALGDAIRNNDDVAGEAIESVGTTFSYLGTGVIVLVGLTLISVLWRFELLPWHGGTQQPVIVGENGHKGSAGIESGVGAHEKKHACQPSPRKKPTE